MQHSICHPPHTSGCSVTAPCSFLLSCQRQPTGTRDTLVSLTQRCEQAPMQVGGKKSRPPAGTSQASAGSDASPDSSSVLLLAAVRLNVHASASCAGPSTLGLKRSATYAGRHRFSSQRCTVSWMQHDCMPAAQQHAGCLGACICSPAGCSLAPARPGWAAAQTDHRQPGPPRRRHRRRCRLVLASA